MGSKTQTHCVNGHEYTPENTGYHSKKGSRECKTCIKLRSNKIVYKLSPSERFCQHVCKDAGLGPWGNCWHWAKNLNENGYGTYSAGRSSKNGSLLAHRYAYELEYGTFDKALSVRHKCDNPQCVNPAHLELGTHAQNMADMKERGRSGHINNTHCPHGHEYSTTNTIYNPNGARVCKTCRQQYIKASIQKRKLKAV